MFFWKAFNKPCFHKRMLQNDVQSLQMGFLKTYYKGELSRKIIIYLKSH